MLGNAVECVLVKLTLKMFNRCLRLITLKSGDRLDKLMALFIMEKMNLSKREGEEESYKEGHLFILMSCNIRFRKGEKLPRFSTQTETFIVRCSNTLAPRIIFKSGSLPGSYLSLYMLADIIHIKGMKERGMETINTNSYIRKV